MFDYMALWVFPESDFADWQQLVGSPQVADYQAYLTLVAAVQADQERSGREVRRVYFSVGDMIAELAARGLDNTPDNRAAVAAFKSK